MIKVLVADDHALVRQGMVRVLSADRDLQIIGEASNGIAAIEMARKLKPDVIMADLYMPGLDGIALTRLVKQEMPEVQVVLVTASAKEEDVVEAVRAGARGYILKSSDPTAAIKQIKQAAQGGVALSEDVTMKLVTAIAHKSEGSSSGTTARYAALTARERDVLALVAQGKTNKEISTALIVSVNTTRAHVRSLMQKLNLENRTQLAIHSLREGFVSPETPAYPS